MWSNEYISIPYRPGGRDRYGCDCYGLVRLILKERFDKLLPELSYDHNDNEKLADLVDEQKPLLQAERVDKPREGDVVVMRFCGLPTHLGIMVDEYRFIHISNVTHMSCIERIDNTRVKDRIEGFYRVC